MKALALWGVFGCGLAWSQAIALSNGVHLRIDTSFGEQTTQQIRAALEPAGGNSFYRIFRDQNGLAVYAYVLVVDRLSSDEFRLSLRPAGEEFAAKFPQADGGKPTPTLPIARVLGLVHSGDNVTVEAFEMPGTGTKIVDTIRFMIDEAGTSAGGGEPLRFAGLRVSANRIPVPGPVGGDVSGRYAMFYIPGKGGYFFTRGPVQGRPFVQAGWAEGVRMEFTLDNETFDCTATEPFLSRTDRGEIWAYHDASYRPAGAWTQPLDTPAEPGRAPEFFAAAADSLGWWLLDPGTK